MNDPRFGAVFSTRTFTTVRAMLVAPVATFSQGKQNWCAIVLSDEEEPAGDRWPVGGIITVAPEGEHIVAVAEDED